MLERLGHTYDYEFDWTPKLNNASTPSGSLHASDAGEERGKGRGYGYCQFYHWTFVFVTHCTLDELAFLFRY